MEKISLNDKKRIVRILEIYKATGKNKTEQDKESRKNEIKYDFHIFEINIDREILYERINKRVDIMIEQGLIKEVEDLLKEEAIEKIKQESRRYAKRQLTWFRRIENKKVINGLEKTQNNINIILEG